MKIGVVTSYSSKNPAGLDRFLIDLLQELSTVAEVEYVVYTKKGLGLISVLKKNNIFNIRVIEVGFGIFWKDVGLLFAERSDAYIFNGPMVPVCFSPKNYFVILHDFAYKFIKPRTMRECIKRKVIDILTRRALARSKKIITVSNTTKNELLFLYGGEQKKTVTIYPGFKQICSCKEEIVPDVREPYFLCVGTIKERKNTLSVVKAYAKYKKKNKDNVVLVIAGKSDLSNQYVRELYDFVKQEGLMDFVIFTGHISDAQISFMYQHARALIFPSLLEGFGFPILEAMSCKVPVITSNFGSLAEISQDASIQVNPLSIDEIVEAMEKLSSDEILRASMVTKGLNRLHHFTWSKTAKELQKLVLDNSQSV